MASAAAPRYRQVADALQRRIASGDLGSHDRLASERVIADRFGLSRMTARQAVELLVRRGVVYRRPGSGTFVSPPRIEHTLQRLAGFSEQMRRQGVHPTGRVLEMRCSGRIDAGARDALELARRRAGLDGAQAPLRRRRAAAPGDVLGAAAGVPRAVAPRALGTLALHGHAHPLRRRPGQRRDLARAGGAGRGGRPPPVRPPRRARDPRDPHDPRRRRPPGRVRPRPLPRRPRPLRAHAADAEYQVPGTASRVPGTMPYSRRLVASSTSSSRSSARARVPRLP